MERYKQHMRLRLPHARHLTVERHEENADYPLHWHSYFEIEIMLSGTGTYVINDVEYEIGQGAVFVLTPTDFHDLHARAQTQILNISFDEEMLDEAELAALMHTSAKKCCVLAPDAHARLLAAAELLEHECKSGGDCQRALLHYILRSILQQEPGYRNERNVHDHGMKRALLYMELHFREDISLARLAAEAGYHPNYFSELFKRATGETYITALTKLRLGYARMLLANGFSVYEACAHAGFGSLSHFSATFRRLCHMSPGEYRRRHRPQTAHSS